MINQQESAMLTNSGISSIIGNMRSITEAADESKLTHLEHAEDHVINSGFDGFAHAYHNLQDVHDQLSGKKS